MSERQRIIAEMVCLVNWRWRDYERMQCGGFEKHPALVLLHLAFHKHITAVKLGTC